MTGKPILISASQVLSQQPRRRQKITPLRRLTGSANGEQRRFRLIDDLLLRKALVSALDFDILPSPVPWVARSLQ